MTTVNYPMTSTEIKLVGWTARLITLLTVCAIALLGTLTVAAL